MTGFHVTNKIPSKNLRTDFSLQIQFASVWAIINYKKHRWAIIPNLSYALYDNISDQTICLTILCTDYTVALPNISTLSD